MKLEDISVGDVFLKEDIEGGGKRCTNFNDGHATGIKITKVNDEYLHYELLGVDEGKSLTCYVCIRPEDLIKSSQGVATTSEKTSIMQIVTSAFKRFTDKPTQKLFKAGFINGGLELTEEGKDALFGILLDANKTKLVALAQEVIDEEKE